MSNALAELFWRKAQNPNVNDLDRKHTKIVKAASKLTYKELSENLINWNHQKDSGAPLQLNKYNLKNNISLYYLREALKEIIFKLFFGGGNYDYFYDDIDIIKIINGWDILKKCPIHETPGNHLVYYLEKDISTNIRWLRYVYFLSVLRNNCKDELKNGLIIDIGSFYGGFQYIFKKNFPSSKHILIDLDHQNTRAAIYLSKSFPDATISGIYDFESLNKYKNRDKDPDFLIVSVDMFSNLDSLLQEEFTCANLVTNFYSLGEMPKNQFDTYLNSSIIKNANSLYFCNRWDSSPFYEPTYEHSYSVLEYIIPEKDVVLLRNSGIHYFQNPVRNLYGRYRKRPLSATYFDLIQRNKKQ